MPVAPHLVPCRLRRIRIKTNTYTEAQIIAMLRQVEGSVPVTQLCREHGMSDVSFQKWRAKHGGMETCGSAHYWARELI